VLREDKLERVSSSRQRQQQKSTTTGSSRRKALEVELTTRERREPPPGAAVADPKVYSKRKYQAPVMTKKQKPPETLFVPKGIGSTRGVDRGGGRGDRDRERDRGRARSDFTRERREDDEYGDEVATEGNYHLATSGGYCGGPFGRDEGYDDQDQNRAARWYEKRFPILSRTFSDKRGDDHTLGTLTNTLASSEDAETIRGGGGILGVATPPEIFSSKDDGDYLKTKQSVAWLSICVTVVQLLILMLQFAMCGIAEWNVNPFIGPYPDAFSEWGGKNAYLMKEHNQWWRLITPSFLHVGFLHLLANAFCQLEAIALFEREWGSFRWLLIYLLSSVGCQAFSSFFDPDTIAVGSSGPLMGLYAAKLAQVASTVFFEVNKAHYDNDIRLDQLSSVLCGLTIVSIMSSFTYIDWSGHMGGLLTGFLSGMVLFSCTIRGCCSWFLWSAFGFSGLVASLTSVLYFFVKQTEPDEEMGDACEYFRNLFPEGYECGCMWG